MGRNTDSLSPNAGFGGASREILIPHDLAAGPLTAVRNVTLQSSIGELKANGYYERYVKLIDPVALEELTSSVAPGWIPVKLALAHYEACENLDLSQEEFDAMGERVGDRIQGAALVSLAKKVREANFDLWLATGPLHRMVPRLFQGGSVQIVKVGPKSKLNESRGFRLNRYNYYRQGYVAALRATYTALGARIVRMNIVDYSEARDELVILTEWL